MTKLSLREAAQQAGVSKSTLWRAIQTGRLSAPRTDDGGFSIDPAELFRAYPPKAADDSAPGRAAGRSAGHPTTPLDETELRIRNAMLEAQLDALRQLIEAERRRADEIRSERDKWAAQAERLALPPPDSVIAMPGPAGSVQKRRWWRWG